MLTLSPRNQIIIGLVLTLLMIGTRGHHFATLEHLPGASWAVFFLAGVYLRPAWVLPGLLALTWLLDFAAFTWGGASGFCLTPAYIFLLPAYSALWFSGRWYTNRHRFEWRTLMPLALAMLAGAAVCELFSSGGFYFFSGRFTAPNFAEFAMRLVTYFPAYLQSLAFYVGVASVLHTMVALTHNAFGQRASTAGHQGR
ncbi:hypothetical protein [Sulfuriflexus mobilis]|uniref:hypothetical protein n=1 Tax=Sulfuriflexus mobilis TaxID=1811807 RepID=UPI000F8416C8|nr:hypothetical protein [Sulfuriflexus mobilis]